ncbi:MAG: BMC domain-containing protein [Bdellovibrionota bacterium]
MAQSGFYREMELSAPALGFIELSSISRGLYLTDAVLKKAPIDVIVSQPISSGKHVLLFTGDVASVEEAHREAVENSAGTVVKQILIPGVHEQLIPFLDSIWKQDAHIKPAGESVGIVESLTLSGAILAADYALKAAAVWLCRMRLGQGIGGKAYFVLSGKQEDVEAALDAARDCLGKLESLLRVDLIPRPQEDALSYF